MSDTPVTITALVDGVVARLTAKIQNFAIEPFPDQPKKYKLTHQRGAFLVAYRQSNYDESVDTDVVAQERTMLVDVHVQSRALNGAGGVYDMIEAARVALVGYALPGFTKFAAGTDRFIGCDENVWTYAFTAAARTMAVELDDDVAETLLHHLTMVSPFSTSEITA